MRSPEVAGLLALNWYEAEWPRRGGNGYGESNLPLSALFFMTKEKDLPGLVYVYRTDDEEIDVKDEKKFFGTERVLIASHFFRCFRIHESDVPDPEIRRKYLKSLPCVIFLDPQGNEAGMLSGAKSARKVFSKMTGLYSRHFAGSLAKAVRNYAKMLKKIEKAEDGLAKVQRELDGVKERDEQRPTPQTQRRIEKLADLAKDARTKLDSLLEEQEKLLRPVKKSEAVASGR